MLRIGKWCVILYDRERNKQKMSEQNEKRNHVNRIRKTTRKTAY